MLVCRGTIPIVEHLRILDQRIMAVLPRNNESPPQPATQYSSRSYQALIIRSQEISIDWRLSDITQICPCYGSEPRSRSRQSLFKQICWSLPEIPAANRNAFCECGKWKVEAVKLLVLSALER